MAQVLEQMYPGVKLTLGPAISNGFYYDIDFEDQNYRS
jgi:threonyl-tRNA synthetase